MKRGNKNNQSGAVIVEATIALTTFMFAIVIILFVSHICYAQAKIGTVIDGVAKDLSEFSYLYSLTGLAEKHSKLSEGASKANESIGSVVDNLSDVTTALGNMKQLGSSVVNDSEMQQSMLDLLKNEGANKVESLATAIVVKKFAKGRLSGTKADCETVLKKLGIEKTHGTYLDSIDFGDSVFCVNGSSEIKVVASYSVKLITLLNQDITFDIMQCAATKAWGAAKKSDQEVMEPSTESGEETTNDNESTTDENETTEEETTVAKKSVDELAKDGTHNTSSKQVLLGSGSDFVVKANEFGMTYFNPDEETMDELYGNIDPWTVNKKFLEQQLAQGKSFYISTDPSKVRDSTLKREILWLKEQGYEFKSNALGLWEAVR